MPLLTPFGAVHHLYFTVQIVSLPVNQHAGKMMDKSDRSARLLIDAAYWQVAC
jgi:hypothetical protein